MSEQQQAVKRDHVASSSGDVLETQVARLREVLPEVFVDGKIDSDKLKRAHPQLFRVNVHTQPALYFPLMWPTLYNRVGVVKGHVEHSRSAMLSSWR